MKPRMRKSRVWPCRTRVSTPSTWPRQRIMAAPVRMETSRTCRISPRAKASTRVVGMMLRKKPMAVKPWARVATRLTPSLATRWVACRPVPGWTRLTTTKPVSRPSVLTTSKYSRARRPMRPSLPRSLTWARPMTTLVNRMGASIMRSRAMKPSPSGFMAAAVVGETMPRRIARAMAMRTWTQRGGSLITSLRQGPRGRIRRRRRRSLRFWCAGRWRRRPSSGRCAGRIPGRSRRHRGWCRS